VEGYGWHESKLIHGYFGVNLNVIWKTIKERLPKVRQSVKEMSVEMKKKQKEKLT
jgi:uncharacterized protein with HEPN domain